MATAFVLSGGGSLAAVQVGMMQALDERGIRPDLLVGTSAGAINAAYVAGYGSGQTALEDLARLWTRIRRADVFPLRPVRGLLGALGVRDSLCSPDPLGRLLTAYLPYSRVDHAAIDLHVVATDLLTGQEVLLSDGDARRAVLASCAIPGIFPAVRRDDRLLADGALADNSAISQAAALGADRIYLLPTGTSCALDRPPRHPLSVALHAVTLLLQQRAILETRQLAPVLDLRVLPPLCPLTVSVADFGQAATLIRRAREETGAWLDSGADLLPEPERFLALHSHSDPPDRAPVDGGPQKAHC